MKSKFVLELYVRLKNGEALAPESVTEEFGVCERTFYRYVNDLKSFFEKHDDRRLIRDKETGTYKLA